RGCRPCPAWCRRAGRSAALIRKTITFRRLSADSWWHHWQPSRQRVRLGRRASCHQRLHLVHEALHRIEELSEIAIAVKVDLEGIDTRFLPIAHQFGGNLGGGSSPRFNAKAH